MKHFLIGAFSFFLFFNSLQSQKSFNLKEAIDYAKVNNHNLNIQKLNVQDVEGQLKEYYAIGLPKLSGSVSYNYFLKLPTSIFPNFISPAIYDVLFDENLLPRRDIDAGPGVPVQFGTKNNLTAGLEFSTLLFDGSFFVGLKAQRLYKDLIIKQINQTESEIKYQVTKAYLGALAIQENLIILNKNISNLQKVNSDLNEFYKSGLIEKLDVDRTELSLQNLNTEKEKLQRLANITLNVLKFQINYPFDQELLLSDKLADLLNTSYVEIMDPSIQLNYNARPEYPVILQGLQLAEINVKRYKTAYLPSLYGFASFQESLQRNKLFDSKDNDWFPTSLVGLNLSVPIFDGFDKKGKIIRAKMLLDKTKLQQKQFESAAQLEFQNAKIQYLNANATIESRKKTIVLAESIYNTAKIKFKEGVGSSLEVSNAERDLYQAQANLLDAQINLIQAKVDLDKSMGKI